jgi:hypothetical protein
VWGNTAGKSWGEVTICTLPGRWEMVGAFAAKQCCCKHCFSLGAADAIGAAAIIAIAAAPATKAAVLVLIPVPYSSASAGPTPPWAASAPAAVARPFRMYSNPTAMVAPIIGPTR